MSKENRVSAIENEISAKRSVFSEVIHNITRVNNVLENLISDYEKLKKIYQSEETFENDSFSEAEIGEIVKGNKESRSRKKTEKTQKPTKTTKKTGKYATQMFVYEYGKESDDETESNEKENIKEIKRESTTESFKGKPKKKHRESEKETIKEKPKKLKRTPKNESVKELTTANELKIKPVKKKVMESKREPKVEYLKEESIEYTNISDNETESYYDDSSNEGDSSGETNTLTLDKPQEKEVEEPVTYTIKRYELDNNQPNGEIKRIRDHSIKVSLVNGSKPVWKIVRSEDFSKKNIWNDIVQNKPVNLKKVSEKAYYRYRASFDSEKEPDFRRNNDFTRKKKKIILRTNDITVDSKESLAHNKTMLKGLFSSKESFEYNKTMEKELFKTKILRKAYGDACLKVVIKKCYKACKRVASVCKIHGCKGSFQTTFKHNAKTGCIHIFKPPAPVSPDPPIPVSPNPVNQSILWVEYKRRANTDNFDSVFYDVTNNGYLAAVCLPDRRSAKNLPYNELGKEYNILRDRFERACQRTSSKKCTRACQYSIDQTCSSKTCNKKLRNALKKACKTECKKSYGVSSSSDKEESSSSSSESSSSSASSESDSGDKKKPEKKVDEEKKKLKETKTTKKKKEKKKDKEEDDDEESEEEDEEEEEEEKKDKKKKKGKKEEKKKSHKKKHTKKKKDKTRKKKKETKESTDDEDVDDPTL